MNVTRYENKIFSSNTYILSSEEKRAFWVIDIGDLSPVFNYYEEGFSLRGVFLTHSHFDHIYGINSLIDSFPECVIYASELAKKGLFSEKLNLSYYHENPIIFKGSNIHIVREKDKIELFENNSLEILETPGHSPGSICIRAGTAIFTGDTLLNNTKTPLSFPHSNKKDYQASIEKLKRLIIPGMTIYPGHGQPFIFQGKWI